MPISLTSDQIQKFLADNADFNDGILSEPSEFTYPQPGLIVPDVDTGDPILVWIDANGRQYFLDMSDNPSLATALQNSGNYTTSVGGTLISETEAAIKGASDCVLNPASCIQNPFTGLLLVAAVVLVLWELR